MARWLERLRRLSERLTSSAGDETDSTSLVSGLDWQSTEVWKRGAGNQSMAPGPPADPRSPTSELGPATTRFSVWERLAGDPGAAALRARWEARWDEF